MKKQGKKATAHYGSEPSFGDRCRKLGPLSARGYSVRVGFDGISEVSRDGFWGKWAFEVTPSGQVTDVSHPYWPRTIALMLAYGLGVLGSLYFYHIRNRMKEEIQEIVK